MWGDCWSIRGPHLKGNGVERTYWESRRVQSAPSCYNGSNWEVCVPLQDVNRAVTVTASLPSLQGCCLPKGSAVTYICQALLALPASENHFSLNFITVYLFVFSSFVWALSTIRWVSLKKSSSLCVKNSSVYTLTSVLRVISTDIFNFWKELILALNSQAPFLSI